MKYKIILILGLFLASGSNLYAATLSVSPNTGVYTTGSTFTVRVVVNTDGKPINAADATLSYNPSELQVVSVSRGSSIFNLWTTEPTFSNGAGTINFSGGSPTGYTGSGGTVMTATFKTIAAGNPRVSISNGSVLAADGKGTNVLTSMGGGSYTISAAQSSPTPDAIVEFVPPANTPAAPKITSDTHQGGDTWSKEKTARLSWNLPADIEAVRTLLDESATAIPNKVYDTPIRDITISDLPDGVSYFHIQFKNKDGWGKVTHYKLAVDSTAPTGLTVSLAPDSNLANPTQKLVATTTSGAGAPITLYKIQVNGGETKEYKDEKGHGEITLEGLKPGKQTLVIEAIDAAQNSAVTTFTFDIEAFDAPRFVDVPATINLGVIPVLLGTTRPRSTVYVTLESNGFEPKTYEVSSDETGAFRFIPDAALNQGSYRMFAYAKDEFGAQSVESEKTHFVVEPSGLLKVGSYLVSALSVIIPLVALVLLLLLGSVYFLARFKKFRFLVSKESKEVAESLHAQFAIIRDVLEDHESRMTASRKTKKLTIAESALIGDIKSILAEAEGVVDKEVSDVTKLTIKNK